MAPVPLASVIGAVRLALLVLFANPTIPLLQSEVERLEEVKRKAAADALAFARRRAPAADLLTAGAGTAAAAFVASRARAPSLLTRRPSKQPVLGGRAANAAAAAAGELDLVQPPPLPRLARVIAANGLVRGLLMPFAVLVASERHGGRAALSRALSGAVLGAVAVAASPETALCLALAASALAALTALLGSAADRIGLLSLSTVFATLSYAALPLAQSIALPARPTAAPTAAALGTLSAVDAIASVAGVELGVAALRTSSWLRGQRPTVYVCLAACTIALGALATAAPILPPPLRPLQPRRRRPSAAKAKALAPAARGGSGAALSGGGAAAGTLLLLLLLLSLAFACASAVLHRGVAMLPTPPSAADRAVDGLLRLLMQGMAMRALCSMAPASGGRGAAMLGCALLAAGSVFGAIAPLTPSIQRAGCHAMTAGLYALETAACTLVALAAATDTDTDTDTASGAVAAASGARRRRRWRGGASRVALCLVLLHMAHTLAPTALPMVSRLSGAPLPRGWQLLPLVLLPPLLVALTPRPTRARQPPSTD